MMPFLRLIRWKNLIIVSLTMYGLFLFFHGFEAIETKFQISYHLFVLGVVLITAGGNIINDYFDVEADKINKRDKLIVTKHISTNNTLKLYILLNLLALCFMLIASVIIGSYFSIYIGLAVILLLLFYSKVLKKKNIFGNVLVSLLVALVPLVSMLFLLYLEFGQFTSISSITDKNIADILSAYYFDFGDWSLVLFLSFISFIINLIREIVKDLEDVEGDKMIHSKSLPIIWGEKKTSRLIQILTILVIVSLVIDFIRSESLNFQIILLMFPILLIILMLSLVAIFIGNEKKLRIIDALLKSSLLIGCLLPYYWFWIR